MNILYIAPFYPSLKAVHAGGVCMGKELNELRKNNMVYSLSFIQKKYDKDIINGSSCDECILLSQINKLISIITHPLIAPFFATRSSIKFERRMAEIIEKYKIDAIHAEYTSMAQYVKIKKRYPEIIFNVVLHDVTIQSYERKIKNANNFLMYMYLMWSTFLVKRNEGKWLSKANTIFVFNEKDKKLVREKYGITKAERINTEFGLENKFLVRKEVTRENDGFFSIGFMGQMQRKENIEGAERLISIYKKELNSNSKIKIYIVGNNPSESLKKERNENVIITGFIDNVDKFLIQKCDVAVFPLNEGAGIKVKVLHCMALGIPVITNKIGAEGIDEKGKYIKLAESDKQFAECICECRNKQFDSQKEIDYIQKEFSWNRTKNIFSKVYR